MLCDCESVTRGRGCEPQWSSRMRSICSLNEKFDPAGHLCYNRAIMMAMCAGEEVDGEQGGDLFRTQPSPVLCASDV